MDLEHLRSNRYIMSTFGYIVPVRQPPVSGGGGGGGGGGSSSLLNGILNWYTMNEASGNRADSVDSAPEVPVNGPTGAAGFGNVGNVSVFVSESAQMIGFGGAWFTASPWTVAGWVLINEFTNGKVWYQGSGTTVKQALAVVGASNFFSIEVDGANIDNGSTVIVLGAWHHVATTYDGVTVNVYLDGSSTPEITHARTASYAGITESDFAGVRKATPTSNFNGELVAWGVWNRVLTATEISHLYNGGNGAQYPFTGL